MPNKYIPCATAQEAKQKSIDAKNVRYPNWYNLQMQKHLENPTMYPHPSRYVEDTLHGIKVDKNNGKAEIIVDDADLGYYTSEDQGNALDTSEIQDEQ